MAADRGYLAAPQAGPDQLFFMFCKPLISPVFSDGCEALVLGAFSALGLRVSLLDFIWPFAMIRSFVGRDAPARHRPRRAEALHKIARWPARARAHYIPARHWIRPDQAEFLRWLANLRGSGRQMVAQAAIIGHSARMADLYLKALTSERKALWATCRLKGLARGTAERQRILAIDEAIAVHKAKSEARSGAKPA